MKSVILSSKAGKYIIIRYSGFQISWKYYTQKVVSNIYVHYFTCSSQHRSDLNHTHPQKDITILTIIYIQFFIIYDKNGAANSNGRQFENYFILIPKHNLVCTVHVHLQHCGTQQHRMWTAGTYQRPDRKREEWFFILIFYRIASWICDAITNIFHTYYFIHLFKKHYARLPQLLYQLQYQQGCFYNSVFLHGCSIRLK